MCGTERSEGQISRRTALQVLGVSGGLIAQFGLEKCLQWVILSHEVNQDWQEALQYRTPEEFIEANKRWLSNIKFGYNLASDHLDGVFSSQNSWYRRSSPIPPPDAVAAFIKEMNLHAGRVAIRMCNALDSDGSVHLDAYDPWLQALAVKDLGISVSTGLKAPRAPEWHIPDWLLQSIYGNNPPKDFGHEIGSSDSLGQSGLEYHAQLAKLLVQYYDLQAYQVENEHRGAAPFGVNWRLKDEYILKVIQVLSTILNPKTQIWINSATVLDMPQQAVQLLTGAQIIDSSLKGRLLAATNYYARFPYSYLDIGEHELADTITNNNWTGMSMHDVWVKQQQAGILGGVTELQCEPWRDGTKKSEEPGNNLQLLFFSLLRLQRAYVFDTSAAFQQKMPVFIWGIEELLRHFLEPDDPYREAHQQIVSFIQQVNAL